MATADIEALRASMRSASVSGKGQYIGEGRHELEVLKLFYKRTLIDGTAKESIICEFKVLASTNPSHEEGSTRSYVESMANQGWLSRFKGCLLALIGVSPDGQIPVEAETAATDLYVALRSDEERIRLKFPANFMEGRRVRAEGFAGKSKKGGDVTNIKWSPMPVAE